MSAPDVTSNLFPTLTYDDAAAAIEWLCDTIGFVRRLVVPGPDGAVMHSELQLGPGVIMVSSPKPEQDRVSQRGLAGHAQALCVYVDDPDPLYERVIGKGARVTRELQDEEYGARGFMIEDPEGHAWYFGNYRPGAHWGADAGA